MPKATTTAPLYAKVLSENGTPYRVRTNKKGVRIVPVAVEIPETDFLHHDRMAHSQKKTVQQRVIALLAQN